MDLLLTGGLVYDGTGSPPERRTVGVDGGRIVLDSTVLTSALDAAGDRATPPANGAAPQIRDVTGLAICPGFVDIHTHSDLTLLSNPLGDSKIRQGVTTEVVGNCGLGVAPLPALDRNPLGSDRRGASTSARSADGCGADVTAIRAAVGYLDLDPDVALDWTDLDGYFAAVRAADPAMNVASLAPHLPLHAAVVGLDDQPATADQVQQMGDLLERAFDAGAVGLSTGLVYAPLCYVAEDELMALGAAVARRNRLFAWHVRDYADDLVPSVQQAIRVARQTGCRTQVSHLQVVGRRNWGTVRTALADIDAARADGCDIAVDVYPYLAGNAPLSQLLPDWAQRGGSEVFAPRLRDARVRARIAGFWRENDRDWNDIVVNGVTGRAAGELDAAVGAGDGGPGIVGRSVAELGVAGRVDPAEVALDLLADYGSAITMIAYGRSEDDLRTVLAHPTTVVASDGQALDPLGVTGAAGQPHPRSYGCFPRYLARYATDLADGIRRCTSAAADRVGLPDRGRIADGLPADLVLLDIDRLGDVATFDDPQRFATGVVAVIVNGQVVIDAGADTGARPGRILRRDPNLPPGVVVPGDTATTRDPADRDTAGTERDLS